MLSKVNLKTAVMASVACLAIGFSIAKFFYPTIEVKKVDVTKEVVRTDVRTITKTIERKDGTKETVTETVDKSVKKESSRSETVVAKKNDWVVSVGANAKLSHLVPVYDIHVQRRILGPAFIGLRGATDGVIGVSVGIEF